MLQELILPNEGKIFSVVTGLFSQETPPKMMLTCGRQHFLKNWKKLTGERKILEIKYCYKTPF